MRLPHGCEGLRVRRMTVLWTFRRPFMGRPVSHQLMRNALLDLTTIVPATAYHRRSYAKRYSRFITFILYRTMQRVFDHAHHALFDAHGPSIEAKLDFILCRLRHVLLPEGAMGKSHNLP